MNGAFFYTTSVLTEPIFENIQNDPRFKELVADKIGEELQYKKVFRNKVGSAVLAGEFGFLKEH